MRHLPALLVCSTAVLLAAPALAEPPGDEPGTEAPAPAPAQARARTTPPQAGTEAEADPDADQPPASRALLEAAKATLAAGAKPAWEGGAASPKGGVRQVGSPPPASETGTGFSFGSYGRVGIGSDAAGHEGYATNVVSHGSRLEEKPYIELDLYYGGKVGPGDGRWRVVIAPAFGGDLFHYNGNFSSLFALRNGYAEIEGFGHKGLRFWVGSRMYRGDDMYLFDYWPLDNLNTVGGGAGLRLGGNDFAIHAGQNLLGDPFQTQTNVAPARGLGTPEQVLTLDRPRTVITAKYTRYFLGGERGLKLMLYGELHVMAAGTRSFASTERPAQQLPSEIGGVAGAQLGMWLRPYTFANLWFRYAQGLGVYGDLGLPPLLVSASTTLQPSTSHARELVGALSLNYESHHIGVMAAAYLRGYTDPNPVALNPSDYVEGAVAVRPQVYLTNWLHAAVELSYQQREFGGFDPTLDRRLSSKVFRASIMPILSPLGRGTYTRPTLYAVYTVSALNQDARDQLFDPSDVRYGDPGSGWRVVHYLGIGAEWWFQSSYR